MSLTCIHYTESVQSARTEAYGFRMSLLDHIQRSAGTQSMISETDATATVAD